jgi:hypothetical protein
MSIGATYVDATTLTATYDAKGEKDLTAQCAVGTKIRADCGSDGSKYGVVTAVSYSDPTTTITMSGNSLTENLVSFDHGNDTQESLVNHGHTGQDDGGTLGNYVQYVNGYADFVGEDYTGEKLTVSNAGSNAKSWLISASKQENGDSAFEIIAVDDAGTTFNPGFRFDRSGADLTALTLTAPNIVMDGDVSVSRNVSPSSNVSSLGTASEAWSDVWAEKINGVVSGTTDVPGLLALLGNEDALNGTDTSKALTASNLAYVLLNRTACKAFSFSRAIGSGYTGAQTVSGIGGTPKGLIMFAAKQGSYEYSIGFVDIASQRCFVNAASSINLWVKTNYCIYLGADTNSQFASLDLFNTDGFTITWGRTGSISDGTAVITGFALL